MLHIFREKFKEMEMLLKNVTAFIVMCRARLNWNLLISVESCILVSPTTAESSSHGDCH